MRFADVADSLGTVMATDPRDWSLSSRDAWVYAIILGWDDHSLNEVAKRHNWDSSTKKRLREMRALWVKTVEGS
jgi:hypothetical protein